MLKDVNVVSILMALLFTQGSGMVDLMLHPSAHSMMFARPFMHSEMNDISLGFASG